MYTAARQFDQGGVAGGVTSLLQRDLAGGLHPDGLDDAVEDLRWDGTVHGEAHQRQAAGLLPTDLHAGDVDAELAEEGPDRTDHSRPVLVAEERHVVSGGDVD